MDNLYRVSAFTKDDTGGNDAGVYIHADHLSDKEMQSIAYEVGYSETAFVLKSDVAGFKVRFFTPITEVDLCGHASIATFYTLRELNIIEKGFYTQETKAGLLKIKVDPDDIHIELSKPLFFQKVDKKEIEASFDHIEFDDGLDCYVVSTGIKEIFVPVKNNDILNKLIPHKNILMEVAKRYNAIGMHVFTLGDDVDAYGRNFAPVVGIDEESATGTSNGALACYLNKFYKQKEQYILHQGYQMGKPSELKATLTFDDINIKEVWIGGKAKFK